MVAPSKMITGYTSSWTSDSIEKYEKDEITNRTSNGHFLPTSGRGYRQIFNSKLFFLHVADLSKEFFERGFHLGEAEMVFVVRGRVLLVVLLKSFADILHVFRDVLDILGNVLDVLLNGVDVLGNLLDILGNVLDVFPDFFDMFRLTVHGHLDEDGKVDRLERDDGRQDEHDLIECEPEELQPENPHEQERVDDQ